MNVPFVTKDGVRLALWQSGEGVPIVFQHGLCGDAGQPAQVFPDGLGFRCLTLECRGHGASQAGPTDQFSIATFADDIAAMIEAQRQGPLVVGGISMGAAIALRLAVKRPDLVQALVLARPAWVTKSAPENMAPNLYVGELLRDHAPEKARALFEASDIVRRLNIEGPDNLTSLRSFFARIPIGVTSELLTRISLDGAGVRDEDLAALKVPVLVIGHDLDFVHPVSLARSLASMIPNATFAQITPKAHDASAYRNDFKSALGTFFEKLANG
jgi:pimeloyl-ACP methyl ester carboxylesterase